jgi:hypothetical protein
MAARTSTRIVSRERPGGMDLQGGGARRAGGVPAPMSATHDPHAITATQYQAARRTLHRVATLNFVIAGLFIACGLLLWLDTFSLKARLGSGALEQFLATVLPAIALLLLVPGVIFFILGLFIVRRSRFATGVLIAVASIGLILSLASANVIGIVLQAWDLWAMLRVFRAIPIVRAYERARGK